MQDVLTMPSAKEAAQLKATLSECITEIDRLRELMRLDDIEIAHSRARTWEMLAEIDEIMKPVERKAS